MKLMKMLKYVCLLIFRGKEMKKSRLSFKADIDQGLFRAMLVGSITFERTCASVSSTRPFVTVLGWA